VTEPHLDWTPSLVCSVFAPYGIQGCVSLRSYLISYHITQSHTLIHVSVVCCLLVSAVDCNSLTSLIGTATCMTFFKCIKRQQRKSIPSYFRTTSYFLSQTQASSAIWIINLHLPTLVMNTVSNVDQVPFSRTKPRFIPRNKGHLQASYPLLTS